MSRRTKHLYLLPVISIVPFVAALLVISRYKLNPDPILFAAVAITYLAVNVIYRLLRGTLKIGYVVEYSLIALFAYFVLSQYA
jgi:hypothetical protein